MRNAECGIRRCELRGRRNGDTGKTVSKNSALRIPLSLLEERMTQRLRMDWFMFAIATGLALFGTLSRFEAWLLVPLFWAIMLLWSKPWLDRFQYGPFEWLWRSLSRGSLQPMRKRALAKA